MDRQNLRDRVNTIDVPERLIFENSYIHHENDSSSVIVGPNKLNPSAYGRK